MATLLAIATGNFTDAATWGVVDATSLLASNTNSTNLTTSYVSSSTFTPGAIEIDGIAVWINSRIGSTGTISIALDQATVTVAGTEVTINVADIPSAGLCWVFFKFAAPVTLAAATAYSVKAKTSSATQVSLFRNSTANNWSRLLRTTTTGAPAAADDLYVIGEKTAAGVGASISIAMQNTAATVFGLVDINSGGTLAYGTSAATAYLLTLAGNLNVRSGGEFNMGTRSGTAMPDTSSGELAFSNAVNVDRGIEVVGSGIFRTAGAPIANPWALLAADALAAATSLTTDRETGWKNGDVIGIASTTRTASQCESKALTADAVGTTLTIAAIANAHGGDAASLVQAELVNITRNVKVHGTSATLQAYINQSGASSIVEMEATQLFWLGSGTSNKRGVDIGSTTGSFYAQYCSFHDFTVASSLGPFASSTANNIDFRHNVIFNMVSTALHLDNTSQGSIVVDDVVVIRVTGSADGVVLHNNNNVSNLRIAGVNSGNGMVTTGAPAQDRLDGSWSGTIVIHSCGGTAWDCNSMFAGAFNTMPVIIMWRCSEGLLVSGGGIRGITFSGLTSFGHTNRSVRISSATLLNVTVLNIDIRAGVTLTCPAGWTFEASLCAANVSGLRFVNGSFGGSGQTHATADIVLNGIGVMVGFVLDNVSLNSATQINGQDSLHSVGNGRPVSSVRSNFLGGVANHKSWFGNGTWSIDTVIFDVSPSLRITPSSASVKLQGPHMRAKVVSGGAKSVTVKVRKSVLGDGAAYNGNQPRLMVRQNYGAGILADTVLDTATAASDGAWETLSGTTIAVSANCALEFFVDCDGTAGWVNVDTLVV